MLVPPSSFVLSSISSFLSFFFWTDTVGLAVHGPYRFLQVLSGDWILAGMERVLLIPCLSSLVFGPMLVRPGARFLVYACVACWADVAGSGHVFG